MKYRTGFVSNSSSSSFIIQLADVTKSQVDKILNHKRVGEAMGMDDCDQAWDITVAGRVIEGYTSMDNFDMKFFLNAIGVPSSVISWEGNMDCDYGDLYRSGN